MGEGDSVGKKGDGVGRGRGRGWDGEIDEDDKVPPLGGALPSCFCRNGAHVPSRLTTATCHLLGGMNMLQAAACPGLPAADSNRLPIHCWPFPDPFFPINTLGYFWASFKVTLGQRFSTCVPISPELGPCDILRAI